MTVVMDDVVARESRHVLQTYKRNAGDAGARRGRAPVRRGRPRVLRPAVRHRRRRARPRASGAGARDRGSGADADPHVEPLLSTRCRAQLAERLARAVGAAARVLLQQRHRSGRSVPEVRAPLLVHARASRATEFIALDESFHGRTFGALSVTSDEHYRAPFEPLLPAVKFVPTNDPAALAAAVSTSTAAIIAEPVHGEGGIRPLTPAFAAAINEACAKTGALFIADEVQSGLGRTGHPLLLPGARARAAPGRRSARRSAAACRSAPRWSASRSPTPSRSAITADLRRQPARLPRGAVRPRRARRRRRCWRNVKPRRPALRAAAAGDRGEAPDRQGGPRRRPDVGARAHARCGAGRAGGPRRTA